MRQALLIFLMASQCPSMLASLWAPNETGNVDFSVGNTAMDPIHVLDEACTDEFSAGSTESLDVCLDIFWPSFKEEIQSMTMKELKLSRAKLMDSFLSNSTSTQTRMEETDKFWPNTLPSCHDVPQTLLVC
jgi:hypothetical protein